MKPLVSALLSSDSKASLASLSRRDWLRRAAVAAGAAALSPRWNFSFAAEGDASKLIYHTKSPNNAEPSLDVLIASWITPVEQFYIRSHAPNPAIDAAAHRVTIDGLVDRPLAVSAAELAGRFPAAEVTATLCCAGNRRAELSQIKPVDGVQWEGAALGNAKWGGVRLADLLRHAGLKDSAKHVWFEGLDRHDKDGREIVFGGSVPIERVLDDEGIGSVLIATRMNGEPLTADHGAPVRALVPGFIGARSVKWLSRIHVADRPSDNHYVQHAYKLVQEISPAAYDRADILYELPLQSVICTAKSVMRKKRLQLELKGYALPPGGRGQTVALVEVSIDGGKTWRAANLEGEARPGCWHFWSAEVRHRKPVDRVIVRAVDSSWRMQPEQGVWNAKGYMFNGWHSVPVSTEPA